MSESTPHHGKTVLVTGANGFIGSRLCARLREQGTRVCGVTRKPPSDPTAANGWKQGDLAEAGFVEHIFTELRPDLVFHLAGHVVGARDLSQVEPTFRDILAVTVNVLQAAARHGKPRLVIAGSMEEPDPNEDFAIPSSPYAAAKAACSGYASMFRELYGLPVVNARVFMVYGPGRQDLRKLIPYVILSLLRGEAPQLSSGHRLVDWVYLDDVVDGLCALAEATGLEGGRLDIGTGRPVSVQDLVSVLVQIVAPHIQPRFGALAERPMEQVRQANLAATTRATGWIPRTSLEEGLRETVRWYAKQMKH